MTREESIQQIKTLIEAWKLDEADLNQTDINAMQVLLKENQELREKFKATNKGLQKAVLKRKKWKYRYQLARCKIKELERIIELCHLDAKETLTTINYEQESQQKEFIKYLEDEIQSCEAVSDLLFNSNREMKVYKEILQKYKEITQTKSDKSV